MKPALTRRQRIIDLICMILCLAALINALIQYPMLPEQLTILNLGSGRILSSNRKSSIFLLLGIMLLMTGSLSVVLRSGSFYRRNKYPWPIPYGRMPLVVSAKKEAFCFSNLLAAIGNVYLLHAWIVGNLAAWIFCMPYILMLAVLLLYLLRIRRICLS